MSDGDQDQSRRAAHRVAAVCYACSPIRSSEPEMSWFWISSLQKMGCEVVAFTSTRYQPDFDAVGRDSVTLDGVEIRFVPPPRPLPSAVPGPLDGWYRYVAWQARMLGVARRLHRDRPFDVAHHVSYGSASQGFRVDALGIPTVLGPVGGAQFPPRELRGEFPKTWRMELLRQSAVKALLRSPFRRRQLRRVAHIFVANPETQMALGAFGVGSELMLDTGSIEHAIASQPHHRSSGPFRLAWVGRVFEIKALGLALEVVERVAERIDVVLEVCGDGPDLERHQHKLDELEARGIVSFHGFVGQDELRAVYDRMDSLLYTSLRDNGGEPLHRALERGRPPIVFDHQGPGAVVTEQCGIRVPVADRETCIDSLADAVVQLAVDGDRYRELSAGALEASRSNTWTRRAQRVKAVYDDLVLARSGSA